MGSGRGWLAGDWLSTGGVLNITAAVWTAGFHWWRSSNKKWTQNVSEYMLVLALCLVLIVIIIIVTVIIVILTVTIIVVIITRAFTIKQIMADQ